MKFRNLSSATTSCVFLGVLYEVLESLFCNDVLDSWNYDVCELVSKLNRSFRDFESLLRLSLFLLRLFEFLVLRRKLEEQSAKIGLVLNRSTPRLEGSFV